jgi:uncharacterized membrane protein
MHSANWASRRVAFSFRPSGQALRRQGRALAVVTGLSLLCHPALATTEYVLPSLFDVAGVAANDVLNIREAPSARARILAELPPDAQNIEVVGYDASGKWARINADEQTGWVALRFLQYRVDVWEPGTLPPSLHCLGNEPFWSLEVRGDTLLYSTPDVLRTMFDLQAIADTGRFRDPRRAVTASTGRQSMTAAIVPMACSDGMSDRAYGLDATILFHRGGGTEMLTGCCSIAP